VSCDRYRSGEYATKNPSWHVEDSAWKATRILELMRDERLEPATVAEVGCGAGEVLRQLHEELGDGVRFVGYDVSPQAIELARSRSAPRLRFELRDIREDAGESFDLILLIDVIEHVQDYFGLLRAVRERAGHCILHIPLDLSALTAARPHSLVEAYDSLGHVHFFAKETALRMLAEAGFEVTKWRYTKVFETHRSAERARLRVLTQARGLLDKVSTELCAHALGGYSLLVLVRPAPARAPGALAQEG
jgi:SAM-dependent methyltransferase